MNDAVRLVQRMGKDWLHEGRRPAGVAAACLYLAARMNNFRRSKAEIVFFAKIAEETLQRRLDEFKNTTAGKLSVQDFRGTNIESEADPPSFTKHRAAEEKMYEELEALEDAKRAGQPEPTNKLLDEDVQTLIDEVTRGETDIEKSLNESVPREIISSTNISPTGTNGNSSPMSSSSTTKSIVDSILRRHLHPEVPVIQWATPPSQVNDHPEDLSDVDDDEIDSFVLNPEEVEIKSRVWMTLNRDYILEQERKRLKMEAEIANGTYKAPRKRRRHKPKDSSSEGLPKDASESTKAMLQQRTFSKKINYAAIDNLFKKES
ncbi:BRF1-domain-containing protein [Nadsonia fulvescens var. elongata DSM 6958]|uniref:BRF1-domain-containing protein n=1 Tax=Nadsonia fulvescens var. elongata DSM 6958 TaxID=857566 RepID=A0A1E3PMX6_9ASCO|nr:BRF1-domain-containing protein [Nadsonia fulvescens var. elongata DSM 6958]